MGRDDNVSGSTDLKSRPGDGHEKQPVEPKLRVPSPAIVLDMGEASREQGFRLNGCR